MVRKVTAVLGAWSVLAAAGLFFGVAVARPAAASDGSHITVTQTPVSTQSPCAPALVSLSHRVLSDADTFVLRVTAAAPLCTPIEATAAVYSMPGNGVAWPQKLLESTRFTLSAAGLTEITFRRPCTPVQFDVINGETPATISLADQRHGPMLFPFDLGTAQQSWVGGPACLLPEPVVPDAPVVPALVGLGAVSAVSVTVWRRRVSPPT